MKKLPDYLIISDIDGSLYDMRVPRSGWSALPPLRPNYCRGHREILTVADLKATLRYGPYTWPGVHPLYFICSDGGALSFKTVRAELRQIIPSVAKRRRDGWRVVACDINYEDDYLFDDHTGEKIECAYPPQKSVAECVTQQMVENHYGDEL